MPRIDKKLVINVELVDNKRKHYVYTEPEGEDIRLLEMDATKEDQLVDCLSNADALDEAFTDFDTIRWFDEEENFEGPDEAFDEFVRSDPTEIPYEDMEQGNYTLEVSGKVEDVIHFLNNNEIKCKKIIIKKEKEKAIGITDKEYLITLYASLNDPDNVYLQADGNIEPVSIKDYGETIEFIEDIAKRVEDKDFSPIEQLMYAYDIVRDRYYVSGTPEEGDFVAKDLTSVIKGDKIVCLGFAEMFDKVAQRLGFGSKVEWLLDNTRTDGHAKNLIYVKDEKYNLNGVFSFDPTYGCKQKDDNSHFDSYNFFARNCSKRYYDCNSLDLVPLETIAKKIESDKKYRLSLEEEAKIKDVYGKLFNTGDKRLSNEKILEYYRLFKQTVYIIAFIEALVTVRKQENLEDPNKFPFSKDKIKEIIKKTHNLYFLDEEDENHFHEAVNRFIQDLGLESKFEEAKVRIHE